MKGITTPERFAYDVSWLRVLPSRVIMDFSLIGMGNRYYKRESDLKKNLHEIGELDKVISAYVKKHGGQKDAAAMSTINKKIEKFVKAVKAALHGNKELSLEEGKSLNQMAVSISGDLKRLFWNIYKEKGKTPSDKNTMGLVSEAVEIAMDTEEVVALYLLRVWGDRREAVKKAITFRLSSIVRRIDDLKKKKGNTAVTAALLEGAKKEIQALIVMNDRGHYFIPLLALKKSDDMVLLSKELAKHYLSKGA